MRVFLKSGAQFLRTGWFWAFILLALPNCALDTSGYCVDGKCPETPCEGPECPPKPCEKPDDCDPEPPVDAFEPGPNAANAIMCDIPKPEVEGIDTCASLDEANDAANISLSEAGTALVNGESKGFALDFSAAATASCSGRPRKIFFHGPFPDGLTLCLNCGTQIPAKYATPTAACVAKCKDLINAGGQLPADDASAFCEANARTATNYDKNVCYGGVCSNGTPLPPGAFVDPRRTPENVKWVNLIGTTDNGGTNTLTMTQISGDFIAGAASAQIISTGDAWVEFEATQTNVAHVVSLRESKDAQGDPCYDAFNCDDTDPSLNNIGFGLILYPDGFVYVVESSPTVITIPTNEPYAAGDRFRVRAVDNHDGKATLSYSRVIGPCTPGTLCTESVFYTSVGTALFPLRVDAALRDQGATIANVTLVRIQQ